MTATPLEEKFILTELKDIQVVKMDWENVTDITVESSRVIGKVKDAVAVIIKDFLAGKYSSNAYFFVNSVSYIKDLVKQCDLTDENCRAIYSKNNKTDVGIKRGTTLDSPKKINFITSTAFEGSDIYDEEGQIFIISDSAETHTLVDISTKFQQIAGRIRNSKYSDKIYHIFKQTRYSEVSYEEFMEAIDNNINNTRDYLRRMEGAAYANKLPDNINDFYFRNNNDGFVFDENKVKIDEYNYKICNGLYKLRVNLINEYDKYGFSVENFEFKPEEIIKSSAKVSTFRESVLAVKKDLEQFNLNSEIQTEVFSKYPFLRDAIRYLGFDEIEKMNYHITNIKRKVITYSSKPESSRVFNLLRTYINEGEFISSNKLIEIFNEIYQSLEILKIVKSTDIKNYYEVKETSKYLTLNNEIKSVKGFKIIKSKIVFN
jgi:antirestriction protein